MKSRANGNFVSCVIRFRRQSCKRSQQDRKQKCWKKRTMLTPYYKEKRGTTYVTIDWGAIPAHTHNSHCMYLQEWNVDIDAYDLVLYLTVRRHPYMDVLLCKLWLPTLSAIAEQFYYFILCFLPPLGVCDWSKRGVDQLSRPTFF